MSKIDIVITWVNGSDPLHFKKRQKYQNADSKHHAQATASTRFGHCGEIYYCIASILKYANFINRIWIVTDNQRPAHLDAFAKAGLCDPDFIQVVDHKIVFRDFEEFLPTFNARSVEAVLWRIPELAEQFVYMNDDFFLNSNIASADFFDRGKPRIFGRFIKPDHRRLKIKIQDAFRKLTFQQENTRPSYRKALERASNLAGFTEKYLNTDHHPHPQRKSVLEEFFAENFSVLKKQVSYRFRSIDQYSPASLGYHLEIARHGAKVENRLHLEYIRPNKIRIADSAFDGIRNGTHKYGCIQSLDECDDEMIEYVQYLMSRKFHDYLPNQIDLMA